MHWSVYSPQSHDQTSSVCYCKTLLNVAEPSRNTSCKVLPRKLTVNSSIFCSRIAYNYLMHCVHFDIRNRMTKACFNHVKNQKIQTICTNSYALLIYVLDSAGAWAVAFDPHRLLNYAPPTHFPSFECYYTKPIVHLLHALFSWNLVTGTNTDPSSPCYD